MEHFCLRWMTCEFKMMKPTWLLLLSLSILANGTAAAFELTQQFLKTGDFQLQGVDGNTGNPCYLNINVNDSGTVTHLSLIGHFKGSAINLPTELGPESNGYYGLRDFLKGTRLSEISVTSHFFRQGLTVSWISKKNLGFSREVKFFGSDLLHLQELVWIDRSPFHYLRGYCQKLEP